jgi:hypothetical protein
MANHALMLFERHSGEPFTYYAGPDWSKADMPTETELNSAGLKGKSRLTFKLYC